MNIDFKMEGLSQLNSNIAKSKWGILGASKQAILEEAQEIMADSVEQVPQMSGALLASASIEQDAQGNVEFGYGGKPQINPLTGEDVNSYMISVHERLDVVHPQGKAKFLEDPINTHKATMESTLIGKIRKFFSFY